MLQTYTKGDVVREEYMDEDVVHSFFYKIWWGGTRNGQHPQRMTQTFNGFLALIVPVDTAVWQVLSPQVKVRENKSKKWFVTTVFIIKNCLPGIISSMEDSVFGLSTTPWNLSQNYLYHWCPTDKGTALLFSQTGEAILWFLYENFTGSSFLSLHHTG